MVAHPASIRPEHSPHPPRAGLRYLGNAMPDAAPLPPDSCRINKTLNDLPQMLPGVTRVAAQIIPHKRGATASC